MLYGIIYLITNLINGRRYVGLTTNSKERRWIVHCSDARCGSPYLLHKAIRKYGEQNFELVEMASASNDPDLRELEAVLIEQEKTRVEFGGYNLTGGGEGVTHFAPQVFAAIVEKLRNHPRNRRITYNGVTKTISQWEEHLGFKHLTMHDRLSAGWSEEACITTPLRDSLATWVANNPGRRFGRLVILELSDSKNKFGTLLLKCLCDCGNIHYTTKGHLRGKTKSCGCLNRELARAKAKTNRGKNLVKLWKPIRCKETGIVYPAVKIAAKETGCSEKNISAVLAGRQHTTNGLHFEYASLQEVEFLEAGGSPC